MIATFDTAKGKYAELHQYHEPVRDADGMPDGYNEVWEIYMFDKKPALADGSDFKTYSFLNETNARLFLTGNGFKEIVL